jgi:hypothetical protein
MIAIGTFKVRELTKRTTLAASEQIALALDPASSFDLTVTADRPNADTQASEPLTSKRRTTDERGLFMLDIPPQRG